MIADTEKYAACIADKRVNKIKDRDTSFSVSQNGLMASYFYDSLDLSASYKSTLAEMRNNVMMAGKNKYGNAFFISSPAMAKINGDILETLVAVSLRNIAQDFNAEHGTGIYPVQLPRGYDVFRLLTDEARGPIRDWYKDLTARNLGPPVCSSPDIVFVRANPSFLPMKSYGGSISDLRAEQQAVLSSAYKSFQGRIMPQDIVMCVAVKKSVRSDRVFQCLREADSLKSHYFGPLKCSPPLFSAVITEDTGVNVREKFKSIALASINTDTPMRAVDHEVSGDTPMLLAQNTFSLLKP